MSNNAANKSPKNIRRHKLFALCSTLHSSCDDLSVKLPSCHNFFLLTIIEQFLCFYFFCCHNRLFRWWQCNICENEWDHIWRVRISKNVILYRCTKEALWFQKILYYMLVGSLKSDIKASKKRKENGNFLGWMPSLQKPTNCSCSKTVPLLFLSFLSFQHYYGW